MRFPSVYEINTRVWLQELGARLGRHATLDDVTDAQLEDIARLGFSWVWLLGVWQTGETGLRVARGDPGLRADLRRDLPDVDASDVFGSPFAVWSYDVHRDFGGDDALARLRRRLARRGARLMLDFVCNHVALDHPWVFEHPEFLVHGSEDDLRAAPQNYVRLETRSGPAILAHGRDPNFDGWKDTVQLNYRHRGLRAAALETLSAIARRCDGVRCDMAMLLEPSVIARTWGERSLPMDGSPPDDAPFWPGAIPAVRRQQPEFVFVAEVYWDFDWTLQQQGFDFTYDKRLYDRLRAGAAGPVRDHLRAAPEFRDRCLRFIENHDEERAAVAFDPAMHRAAAVIALLAPGMRLVHEGEREGRRVHVSMVLGRRPAEPLDEALRAFYDRLLPILARPEARDGAWRLCPVDPTRDGAARAEPLIAMTWESAEGRLLIVVNYGPAPARGTVAVSLAGLPGRRWRLTSLMDNTSWGVDGDVLASSLDVDLEAWGFWVWAMQPL